MPVSLIEAMKSGLIPLVNNIEGGIQELIEEGITGFKINNNDPIFYASCIESLMLQKQLSIEISNNCKRLANQLFDPIKNTDLVEGEIISLYEIAFRVKKSKKVYGSLLDQNWIPNIFTRLIRKVNLK